MASGTSNKAPKSSNNNHQSTTAAKHYPKLPLKAVRIESLLLILLALAIVGLQVYVFVTFTQVYYVQDDNAVEWKRTWGLLYCGLSWASALANILAALVAFCFVPNRTRAALSWALVLAILGAIGALASTGAAAVESHRIHEPSVTAHPCRIAPPSESDCSLWFDLEVSVAALSGCSAVVFLALIVNLCIGLCSASSKDKRSTMTAELAPPVQQKQQQQQQRKPSAIPSVTSSAPPVQSTVQQQQLSVIVTEVREEEDEDEERDHYMEEIRQLSREQLEDQLEQQLQRQFIKELHQEIERRKRQQQSDAYFAAHVQRSASSLSQQQHRSSSRRSSSSHRSSTRNNRRQQPLSPLAMSNDVTIAALTQPTPDYEMEWRQEEQQQQSTTATTNDNNNKY